MGNCTVEDPTFSPCLRYATLDTESAVVLAVSALTVVCSFAVVSSHPASLSAAVVFVVVHAVVAATTALAVVVAAQVVVAVALVGFLFCCISCGCCC